MTGSGYSGGTIPLPSAGTLEQRVGAFLRGVYGWMALGLGITAITASVVASSPALMRAIVLNPLGMLLLVGAQLGVVWTMGARIDRLSASTASALFLGYSVLTGLTMSVVLWTYTRASVGSTFLVSAGMFGALALYGTMTRRNLSAWAQFLFMGLIGVVLASLVGLFVQSDGFQFVLAFCGVIVFAGLTAYDAQTLKAMAIQTPDDSIGQATILGALRLYLDFINLFLMLLRLFGDRPSRR